MNQENNIDWPSYENRMKELPSYIKTIKVDVKVWNSLNNLKKENETFSEVIKGLLDERTKSIDGGNVQAIRYSRKVVFLEIYHKSNSLSLEFEYNDVKGQQQDFTLDLKIKKIFYGKRVFNPSVFFGVENQYKHLYPVYLNLYLKLVRRALEKEFRVSSILYSDENFENIATWKKLYNEYNLSEDSFINDVEEPLRLSEEEKLTDEHRKKIESSVAYSIWGI